MKFLKSAVVIVTVAMSLAVSQALTVKVGSIAPEGSPWDMALKKIAAQWSEISGGEITFKIYPGGIVGSEHDMTRKIRIGQIQAAIFTGVGMSYITPEVMALNLPFLVDNDEELDYLMKKVTPYYDDLMEKKGFHAVAWTKSGWVNLFSKKKVITPDDLKPQALAVSEADAEMLQAWRAIGFNAVPLSTNDTMTALQSGMVEAFYSPPLVSAAFQWFAFAPHMSDLRIAPMLGGLVFSKRTWDKIPDAIKPKLVNATNNVLDDLFVEITHLEENAINTMKKHGMKVHHVPADIVKQWRQIAEKGYDVYVGKTFTKSLYDKLKKNIAAYRKIKK